MVRLRVWVAAVALCVAGVSRGAAPQGMQQAALQEGAQTAAVPTLSVDTRLVVVPVVVRDKKGALLRNLRKEDFTLAENGRPQTVRYFDKDGNAPLTVGLLVDVSGSQREVLDEERTASAAFLDTLLRPAQDKAFVVQFGRQADLLADVTASLPKLEAGLKRLDADSGRPQFGRGGGNDSGSAGDGSGTGNGSGSDGGAGDDPSGDRGGDRRGGRGGPGGGGRGGGRGGRGMGGGGTVLYDAIFLSSDEVIRKETNRKALVLLTDGGDRGSRESVAAAIEAAQRANAAVYAVFFKGDEGGGRRGGGFPGGGFPGGGGWPGGGSRGGGPRGGGEARVDGRKVLERICGETGGRVFEVTKKQPIAEIYRQISEELRSEYRLGFTPTDATEGYHRVVVDLPADKKSSIQAREGYYIGAAR